MLMLPSPFRDNQPEKRHHLRPWSFCFDAEWAITFNLCQFGKSSRQNYFPASGCGIKCSHYRGHSALGKTVFISFTPRPNCC
ncbi:hypothetical protein KCP78_06705 [Salmonella enterica subsp. enterica]|nr:hypothetical protein KCP78_06705 [Salmonella enterica subsp. enterica]